MTGDELIALVNGRSPVDERERVSIDRFVQEVTRLERPLDEHADATHVTGSAFIVGPRGIVLHLHRRLGIWLQPGGHIDAGETPADAALREAEEETGLAVRHPPHGPCFVHVDVHAGPRGHTHLDLRYVLEAPDDDPKPPPNESPDVRWFDWDAAATVADPGLLGALGDLRSRH